MMPYERFHAWRACHELVVTTYRITQEFPKFEVYGLTSQMRRAAFSTAANIAEGTARRGSAELRRYLDISLGSLSELRYAALVAKELTYLGDQQWADLEGKLDSAGKLTMGLYKAVARRTHVIR